MILDRRAALVGALSVPILGLSTIKAHASLVDSVARIKPSIVGITTVQTARALAAQNAGSGFAVADGHHVVTNLHVVAAGGAKQAFFVLAQNGSGGADRREARIVAIDRDHDLALLAIDGAPLPPVRLATALAPEGSEIAITGFPIGIVLGLVPATHRGIVAAVAPNVSALPHSSMLDPASVRAPRFQVYQLDLLAFPGNSGSPLYLSASAEVIGIVNSGFIKKTREKLLSEPTAITFAIPSMFIGQLLERAGVGR